MNALKNVLFFGLLIAVLCGVYFSLSRQPEATLPEELTSQAKPPLVEVPGLTGPATVSDPGNPSASNSAANNLVAGNSATVGGLAASASGGMAPPYQPPSPSVTTSAPPFPLPSPTGVPDMRESLPAPPTETPPRPDPRTLGSYPAGVRDPFAVAAGRDGASPTDPSGAAAKIGNSPPATTQVSLPAPALEEHTHPASIDTILQQVEMNMRQNNLAAALELLSPLQDNPDVPAYQAQKITEILDYMAAKVIYSREHFLGEVYRVKPGDTLDKIADHYQVPALLLARINGIGDPQDLRPAKELKVLKGPFTAHVSTSRLELKMMLAARYAGRFPMVLSGDLQNAMGLYHVVAKSATGTDGSPTKPQWIELESSSGKIGIQGAPDPRAAAGSGRSTIWLSDQDMDDVYGILSVGSVVIIQR